MTKYPVLTLSALIILLMLSACAESEVENVIETSAPAGEIILYQTATLVPSQVVVTEVPTPTQPPLPTPTPFMYTVVADDTMIAIASRFGVTLDELQAANPEVNPNYLSIGTQLIIPVSFDDEETTAAEQVYPLTGGDVTCSATRSGGLWCYWLLENPTEQAVENISGIIRLYDGSGELLAAEEGVPLLNVLEAGGRIPLAVYFEPPLADWDLAQGQLLSAVAVNQYAARYIRGSISNLAVTDDLGGLLARVSGSIQLASSQQPEYVWVLAVAYDADGMVTGVRRWEAAAEQLGETLGFDFEVFSTGAPIDHVEVMVEARAADS